MTLLDRNVLPSCAAGLALYAALIVTAWLYWPGLGSDFLLDDHPNLAPLAGVGTPPSIHGILDFVSSVHSKPFGRPLALLSFLLNDTTWPSHPHSFKYTNLLIHLINGLLLAWLVLKLMRAMGREESISVAVAVGTAAFWLLHPFNVSTVLYAIQRMTQLATLFILAGLVVYLHGRLSSRQSSARRLVWMSGGIGGGTALALLCKESGILLAVYALIIECTLLSRHVPAPAHWRLWRSVFLHVPAGFIAVWHIVNWSSIVNSYRVRDFSLTERLLTQPRALLDYLGYILLPRREGSGLVHDDYVISTGLADPPMTVIAIGVLATLLLAALWLRKRAPVLSFASLWFVGGHVLESGAVALEIYFEHRNYLPMVGPLFALTYYLLTPVLRLRLVLRPAFAVFVCVAAVNTWLSAELWGNPSMLAATWEREHPNSMRALQYASGFWLRAGAYDEVHARLDRVLESHPDSSGIMLQKLWIDCLSGANIDQIDFERKIAALGRVEHDHAASRTLQLMIKERLRGGCPALDYERLAAIADTLLVNPSFRQRRAMANLLVLRGRIHDVQGDARAAAESLRKAYEWRPDYRNAVIESHRWAVAGEFALALEAVERAKGLAGSVAQRRRLENLKPWEQYLKDRQRSMMKTAVQP